MLMFVSSKSSILLLNISSASASMSNPTHNLLKKKKPHISLLQTKMVFKFYSKVLKGISVYNLFYLGNVTSIHYKFSADKNVSRSLPFLKYPCKVCERSFMCSFGASGESKHCDFQIHGNCPSLPLFVWLLTV